MADESLQARIEALVEEEQTLRAREGDDAVHAQQLSDERSRLDRISVELDRCWDLLRQRRAIRESGGDPGDAHVRDSDTVEKYLQ
jgi:uncharacterized protein DUF2630